MKVLIACEYSGIVSKAFRDKGHDAWSCDILPTEGRKQYHLQCKAETVLYGDWDIMIAFPPCTHLAVSGARWFEEKIKDGRQQQGIDFFMKLINADIEKIAVENPVGIMSTEYRKPDQIEQKKEAVHFRELQTLWLINGDRK